MVSIRYTPDQYPCYLCCEATELIAVVIYTLITIASAYSPSIKILKEGGDKIPL